MNLKNNLKKWEISYKPDYEFGHICIYNDVCKLQQQQLLKVEKAIIKDFEDLDLVINSIQNNDYDKGGILNILKCHKRNKLRNFGDWKK